MAGRLIEGDALEELRRLRAESIDLIVTSPPYAAQRAEQYGGPEPDKYVAWYLPIARELKRVLKQDGSYILNVQEHVADGQRTLHMHDLLLAHVRQAHWRLHDEMIWYKPNAFPNGALDRRFKSAWEYLHWFSRSPTPYLDRAAVSGPPAASTRARRSLPSFQDDRRHVYAAGTACRRRLVNGRRAAPPNVLSIGIGGHYKESLAWHPARFPAALPRFFIRAMCPQCGTVLYTFMGSGTTAAAAEEQGRRWLGIERSPEYCRRARRRLRAGRNS